MKHKSGSAPIVITGAQWFSWTQPVKIISGTFYQYLDNIWKCIFINENASVS